MMAQKITVDTNTTPETFLDFYRRAGVAKRALESAQAEYRNVLKAAKKAGIDTKAMVAARALATSDEPDADRAHMQTLLRYTAYLGLPLGTQLALFDAPDLPEPARAEQADWDAEDLGYRAGRGGADRGDNPYDAGSSAHVQWDGGWSKGQASIAQDMAEGKPPRRKPRSARALVATQRIGSAREARR